MASADQRMRESRSSTSKERPDGGIAERPPSPHALSTSQDVSTRLRKRGQYPSAGHRTNFKNVLGEESAGHTAEVKNGSSERGQSPPATARGLSPMMTATLTPPLGQFVINLLLQLAGIVAAVAFGIFAVESLNVAKQANIEARTANQVAILGICTQSNNSLAFCSRVLANKDAVFPSEVASLFTSVIPTSTTAGGFATSSPTQTHTTTPEQTSGAPSSASIISSNSASTTSSNSAVATSTTAGDSAASSPTVNTTTTPVQTVGAPEPSGTTSAAPNNSVSPRPSTRIVIGIVVPVVSILLVIACTAIYIRRRRYRSSILSEEPEAVFHSAEPEAVIAETFAAEPPGQGPYRDDRMGKESEETGPIPPATGLKKWWKVYRALFLESTVSTR